MNNQKAAILLRKYREKKCTPDELALLRSWYAHSDFESLDSLSSEDWESIRESTSPRISRPFKVITLIRITAAASLLLLISIGGYFYLQRERSIHYTIVQQEPILPGNNRAILTLANGQKISLSDVSNGELTRQTGISISKSADGQLIYTVLENTSALASSLNTISTPKGGQWRVRLPDGSEVFLNAESSLTYPVSFSSHIQRKVALKGEAYFEIAKDSKHPFVVQTDKQEIQVLGTHFNVSSYENDPFTKTTLLEGSVKIRTQNNADMILKPGQQASLGNTMLTVANVDVEESIAWKNGYFLFNDESIESVMNKISRWYNVNVKYISYPTDERFNGTLSREHSIVTLLKMLEETNAVHFKIEGRRILVMK